MFEEDIRTAEIGFVGLGTMGKPMAENALENNFSIIGFDQRESVLRDFDTHGGIPANSLYEIGSRCQSVHVVVRDDTQLESVVFGDSNLFDAFRDRTDQCVLVIHSTVSPKTCIRIADSAPEHVHVIDAPISGGETKAKAGTLSIMAGGGEDVISYCMPLFDAVADNIFHIDDLGSGETVKVANNAIALSNIMMIAEGLKLGAEYGIDEDTLIDVFRASSADSFILQNWEYFTDELTQGDGNGILAFAELCEKDLSLALTMAHEEETDIVGTAVASQRVPQICRKMLDE